MDDKSLKKTMVALNLPTYNFKLRQDEDSKRSGFEIYDSIRQQWVALTPEEWVRQNFVKFLVADCAFPETMLANEMSLKLNGTERRCDTIVFSKELKPVCVIEYKASHIVISQKVFDQIARYNSVIQAQYLIVSNGMKHYCCRYTPQGYKFLPSIPGYEEMCQKK